MRISAEITYGLISHEKRRIVELEVSRQRVVFYIGINVYKPVDEPQNVVGRIIAISAQYIPT